MSKNKEETMQDEQDNLQDNTIPRNGKSRPLVLPNVVAKGFDWELFTPTEQRILVMLSNGKDHTRDELMECLLDYKVATTIMLNHHIANLRAKLRMLRHDIVCISKCRKYHYRWVRNLLVKVNADSDEL